MTNESSVYFQESFFANHQTTKSLLPLFDNFPGVIFYAKDADSRFIAANSAMLDTKNISDPDEIIGKTDHDFHPPMFADAYIAEDRRVMESRKALTNQLWFVIDRFGSPGWFNSTKVPLFDFHQAVIGIAGVRSAVETPEHLRHEFKALAPVFRHLEEHFTEAVSMKEMADLAQLSSTHFNRQFTALLGMSPVQFLHSLRIEKARQLLATTYRSINEIALDTGYHDQSHFTRHFRRLTGVTPRGYRVRFRFDEGAG